MYIIAFSKEKGWPPPEPFQQRFALLEPLAPTPGNQKDFYQSGPRALQIPGSEVTKFFAPLFFKKAATFSRPAL